MLKVREIKSLAEWHDTIRNFLWFSFKKAEGSKEKLLEYINSISMHISNIHSFPDHMYLKDCPHRPSYDPENKSFRKVNDKGVRKLTDILNNEWIRRDLEKCLNFKHTGSIENINSVIGKYAPKRIFFGKLAMKAKVAMAILAHNENSSRSIIQNEDGTPRMIMHSTRHGGPRMRVKRSPKTNDWKDLVYQNFLNKFKNFDRSKIQQTVSNETRARREELRTSLLLKHQSRFAREAQVQAEQQSQVGETDSIHLDTLDLEDGHNFNDPLGLENYNEKEEEEIRSDSEIWDDYLYHDIEIEHTKNSPLGEF